MRLGLFVNDVAVEMANYTTTRLAQTATNRGDEVWYFSAADFIYGADAVIYAHGTAAPKDKYKTPEAYLRDLQGKDAVKKRVTVDDFDVLMLRSDPSTDTGNRVWAHPK